MQILEQVVIIILNVPLWTGTKKLRPEDLAANGIEVDKLPPQALATLGSKRIISPDSLKPLINLKREAERICLAKGVRFLGGYAIPRESVDSLIEELKDIKDRFSTEKAQFLSKYDSEVDKWIAENPPEWAPIIRAAVESPTVIAERTSFNFAPVAMDSPEGMDENKGLAEETYGMMGQLYHEVRVAAKQAFEATFVGRREVNRKALRPILAIKEKLQGLSFLDPETVSETITTIDEVIGKLPKKGPITGSNLDMLAGLVGRRLANIGLPLPPEIEPDTAAEEEEPEEVDFFPAVSPVMPPTTITPIAFDF
ncbi:MAG: DUF3150 domain-containing protein [Deltaproteobacteria bacterium HGW-Deltaproteobacteria-11]|nr:MAG: DUF3150 domain-containing protein [Deltaproteobacteria bacterium HGW-Deltaproteobacteria-11]